MKLSVERLVIARDNPRKTKASEAAHQALVASIKCHGLIQPLVVRPAANDDYTFEVIDGGRRFAAVQEAGLAEVEVVVNETSFANDELGTAANMMRAPMHPLDEASVISRLIADGETAETVAGRFGQTERWAQQRIKLEGLSPKVKNAFREGRVSLAAAQAFTLGTKAEQDALLKGAKEDWQLRADTIHRALVNQKIPASNAIFPLDQYPDKSITRDLFENEVYLTDRALFDELQRKAIAEMVERLKAEGWSDVLQFMDGPNWEVMNKYVKAEGRISKADRSKYVAVVVYSPGSGSVSCDRGYVLRKSAGKVRVGATPADDTVANEEVKPQDCFDLSDSQRNIAGALLTRGIEQAIDAGDTYLACKTLLEPLIGEPGTGPAWSEVRRSIPSYIGVNVMLTEKIEPLSCEKATMRFPSRKAFAKLTAEELHGMIRLAALRVMRLLYRLDEEALKQVKAADQDWFRFDEGFLRRYRLDALQDLCKKFDIETDGRKKKELVADMLAYSGDRKVIPVTVTGSD